LLPFRSIGGLATDELEGELKAIYEEEAFGEWRGKAQQELESFGGGDRADDGGRGRPHGGGGGFWLRALPLALRIVWCAGWVLVRSVRCGLLR